MWFRFLFNFNGVRLIHENKWLSSDNIELFTRHPDLGCGAYRQGHWIYWSWPNDWKTSVLKEMSFFELMPILLAIYLCGGGMFCE